MLGLYFCDIHIHTNDVVRIFEIEIQNSFSYYITKETPFVSLIQAISSQLRVNITEMTVPSPY